MGILEVLLAQDRDAELARKNKQAYQPLLAQLPTTAAAALGPLLTAEDPGAQQQGMGLLSEYLRRQSPEAQQGLQIGQGQLAGQRQAQQTQSYNNMLSAIEEKRRAEAFPLEQRARQQALTMGGLQIQGQQLQNQAAMLPPAPPTDAQIFEREAGYPLPKDYIPGLNPYTGQLQPIPAPNTAAAQKSQLEIEAAERVTKTVTRFLALADSAGATGTELVGPLASQLRKAREDVITAWREQAALGTPTGGELERIESILPDPTGMFRNYYAGLGAIATGGLGANYLKQAMLAPYVDMLETTKADLQTKYKRNWWVPPTSGVVPP